MWKPPEDKKHSLPVAILFIVLLALLVRLSLLVFAYPNWEHGMTHEVTARSILEGKGFSERVIAEDGEIQYFPSAHDMPGAALVLALTWIFSGAETFLYVQLLQIILDSLLCIIVFLIARYFFIEKVSFLGSFLYAIYLPQATMSVQPRADIWLTFGLLLSVYFVIRFLQSSRFSFLFAIGLTIGITVYFKPNILFFPLFLFVPIAIKFGMKKGFLSSFIIMLVVLGVLSPWCIRNYIIFDRVILTRSLFYQTMWEGFGEFQNPFGAINNDEITFQQMKKEGFQGRLATPEYDEFLRTRVLKVVKENPLWYVGIIIQRIFNAILINRIPWGILQNKRFFYHEMYSTKMEEKSIWNYLKEIIKVNPGFLITKVLDLVVFSLFVLGFFVERKNLRSLTLLLIVPIYFVMVHIPIHVEGRYMVHFHWVYLLFGSVFIFWAKEKLIHASK